jgi:multisubunit Na+/H+ antiporter MnhB subunit
MSRLSSHLIITITILVPTVFQRGALYAPKSSFSLSCLLDLHDFKRCSTIPYYAIRLIPLFMILLSVYLFLALHGGPGGRSA